MVWGPAYTINAGEEGVPKPKHIAGILSDIWKNRKYLRPRAGERLQEFFRRLCECRGISDFYAGQVVADMKHVEPLEHASDWHTFVTWGPGSKKGLAYVRGRERDYYGEGNKKKDEWKRDFHELRRLIEDDLKRIGLGDLDNQNLQNCLCEFSKYFGALTGEGKPKAQLCAGRALRSPPSARNQRRLRPPTAPLG